MKKNLGQISSVGYLPTTSVDGIWPALSVATIFFTSSAVPFYQMKYQISKWDFQIQYSYYILPQVYVNTKTEKHYYIQRVCFFLYRNQIITVDFLFKLLTFQIHN